MMRIDPDDVIALVACGIMIVAVLNLFCFAITGAYIGR